MANLDQVMTNTGQTTMISLKRKKLVLAEDPPSPDA